jgi:hypothetical protein
LAWAFPEVSALHIGALDSHRAWCCLSRGSTGTESLMPATTAPKFAPLSPRNRSGGSRIDYPAQASDVGAGVVSADGERAKGEFCAGTEVKSRTRLPSWWDSASSKLTAKLSCAESETRDSRSRRSTAARRLLTYHGVDK